MLRLGPPEGDIGKSLKVSTTTQQLENHVDQYDHDLQSHSQENHERLSDWLY